MAACRRKSAAASSFRDEIRPPGRELDGADLRPDRRQTQNGRPENAPGLLTSAKFRYRETVKDQALLVIRGSPSVVRAPKGPEYTVAV